MKNRLQSVAVFILIAVLFGTPLFSYAAEKQNFSDVASSYWGAASIDFAASASIVNGYAQPDGTYRFKPENAVSREEAMQMLYKTVKNTGIGPTPDAALTAEYETALSSAGIAVWAWECVAYGLEYNILEQDELANFRDSAGNARPAARQEVARWAAKAIGGTLLPAVSPTFTDSGKIGAENLFYVDFLTRTGIMIGDNAGKFNPEANIKRVEFAVICKRLYDLPGAAYVPAQQIRSWQGTLTAVDRVNGKLYLTESDQTARLVTVAGDAEYLKDGQRTSLTALTAGGSVVIACGPFGQVHIASQVMSGQGVITETTTLSDTCTEIVIENEYGVPVHYMSIEGETAVSGDPAAGETVGFIADGVKLLEIAVD